ncbi:MAG TPA: acetyl-CoA C-acyltransferase [Bacteroidia bacterium]|nr:acetyl-CoA C-acyltransferase [Bacteroidia bacterium]
MKPVYIVSLSRTPIGRFNGVLAEFKAPQLGAFSIQHAVEKIKLPLDMVDEVIMGNVLSAGLGQNPARQAALFSGLPDGVICSSVNKVCASSAKAIMLGAVNIMAGLSDVIIAGGFESMTNTPYYLGRSIHPGKIGDYALEDGIKKDGLWDVYNDYHMAAAAELVAAEMGISREMQDAFATESYKRAHTANENKWYAGEIDAIKLTDKKTKAEIVITEDEEYKHVFYDKIPTLKPAFSKTGTITAANASKINDAGIALVLMSEAIVNELGLKPLAKIISFADAEQNPARFPTTPAKAIRKALSLAGCQLTDMDAFEIHEAFSCVALANMKELGITHAVTNLNGGAVALGHPLGVSGARTVTSLISVLKRNGGKKGVAGVCNGGGGASSVVIELM